MTRKESDQEVNEYLDKYAPYEIYKTWTLFFLRHYCIVSPYSETGREIVMHKLEFMFGGKYGDYEFIKTLYKLICNAYNIQRGKEVVV